MHDDDLGDTMTLMPRIYDITPPIAEGHPVWPGDTPPRREVLLDMTRGDPITLSTLHATVHLGAHADAPSHYAIAAPSIEECPLDLYLGPCQVIRLSVPRGALIGPGHLPRPILAGRVLLATGTFPDPARFNEDFAAIDPALIDNLRACGVRLLGVDTPSVDPFDSKELPAHRACLEQDMAILEGLALAGVPEGCYELIALPLRLVGYDASPVRAILRSFPP
jgi:arylformamidase